MIQQNQAVLSVDVGGHVDGSALRWSGQDEAVGAENAATRQRSPKTAAAFDQQAVVVGILRAVIRFQLSEVAVRGAPAGR
jgi:hypothetical protein